MTPAPNLKPRTLWRHHTGKLYVVNRIENGLVFASPYHDPFNVTGTLIEDWCGEIAASRREGRYITRKRYVYLSTLPASE